ncbi:MAG: AMP-dependent synthetase and ligase [Candidatus Kaiserbacteria bacterium GW2011_GWA2_49_19]|uniref:AMP-dependent synthetase and ligase n=1 Tax=Candidatus Kaiserbacteria bacterium GW2011_GWA2_49_19 TaxID=1618669 RepID=A0A0G1YSL0_9BACT|nr:MAG: AMP-dependent synthetase and ligase [Candidatus Kaiserbacteria bacterium GW2011_GWA2_49_19]
MITGEYDRALQGGAHKGKVSDMNAHRAKSLYSHIASLAKEHPSRSALLSCDTEGTISREINFKKLKEEIESAAAYLFKLGLEQGDRVALAFKNSPELLVISWAAWSTGIITIPLDTKRDTGEQHAYKIKLNGAKLVILQKGALKDEDRGHLRGVNAEEFSGFSVDSHVKISWESGLSHEALVLFTSGTTAHPKGAKLSLNNLIVNAESIREWLRITENDRFLVNLPLHHINSTTFCLSTLLAGGSIAIPPAYSNSHFWQQMAKTGATITSIVQSILFDQLNREEEYAAARKDIKLNRIQIGSAPVIATTVEEFRKKFGIPLYQGYGQTETALRVTGVPMGLPEELYEKLVEENSIGAPMQWADVRISDESGKFLGEGEEGEIIVKGEANMKGYVGGEPAFRDGYFLTGDVGFFRVADGKQFFYLKGRKREIIIKGGINISPIAVENSLKKISPDIGQVHVVAVPDERYGEETGAVISWKEGTDIEAAKRRLRLSLLCGTPHLSAYETPKYITSLTVAELPTTSTGKVQRTILKQQLPYERFESIYGLFKTPEYRFTVLHRYSRWVKESYELYNRCWEPLMAEKSTYEKDISKQVIILAVDSAGHVAGQIALVRTDLSSDELLHTKYDELLTPKILSAQGKNLVCISICSADYKPRPVPAVKNIPSEKAVLAYVPQDPVFKFHQKPKAGLLEGAHLVGLIKDGRPEDKSSLGYNMLLQYPEPKSDMRELRIHDDAPVSHRLIEAVLVLARDVGIKNVYAYSRPGGLASHVAHIEAQ